MFRAVGFVVVIVVVVGAAALGYARVTGLRAAATPAPLEAALARSVRRFAVPDADRTRPNPVPASAEAMAAGMAHFADHCASCHANDGSGDTSLGRGMFPPPPDMRQAPTQAMTDGELFFAIEQGIRFTGMPAFGSGEEHAAESWELVHFIRHLPRLSAAEIEKMRDLNPRSAAEIRQEIEEERFLRGEP